MPTWTSGETWSTPPLERKRNLLGADVAYARADDDDVCKDSNDAAQEAADKVLHVTWREVMIANRNKRKRNEKMEKLSKAKENAEVELAMATAMLENAQGTSTRDGGAQPVKPDIPHPVSWFDQSSLTETSSWTSPAETCDIDEAMVDSVVAALAEDQPSWTDVGDERLKFKSDPIRAEVAAASPCYDPIIFDELLRENAARSKFASAVGSTATYSEDPDCVIFECHEAVGGVPDIACSENKSWTRVDPDSKCFLTTLGRGPKWKHVSRRVTYSLDTNLILEDIVIDEWCSDAWLHRPLPEGVNGTRTVLFHCDPGCEQVGFHIDSIMGASHAEKPRGVSAELLEKYGELIMKRQNAR